MATQNQPKTLTVTNYDKIKALASNQATIQRFTEMLGSKPHAISYISSALLAVANSDELMQCTPSSVFNSVMRAAALRLSCDPATKQAHIVPFYNNKKGAREAQFIPGYVGLNQMAQRTGKYRVLNTGRIYEGQVIEINQLTGVPTIHGAKDSDKVMGYFHYFELFTGMKHILYMTVEELRAHGDKFAGKNPMWKNNFDAMARKTVTRLHLLRDGILDPFDKSVLEAASDEAEGGEIITNQDGNYVDATFTDADDETAAAEAAAHKIEEAAKPKKSEAELMGEMGFDPPAPKPAAQPAPAEAKPWTNTKVSQETAQGLLDSKKVSYWSMDTKALADRHGWILNTIRQTDLDPDKRTDLEYRRDVVAAIIEYRK